MKNIILFGGAFDPIHNGHLAIASKAIKQVKGEKVIFIPAFHSPFKGSQSQPKVRLKMLESALKDQKQFEISTFELEKKAEKSYSIDTVRYFKKIYPEEEYKLYFLIGSDQVNRLNEWHQINDLCKEVTFLVYPRAGSKVSPADLKAYPLELIEGEEENVSSTSIRLGTSFYAPKAVLDYIVSQELYYIPIVKGMEKPHRYAHSLSVAELSYKISLANGLDEYKAFGAGLLHDITRMKSTSADIKKTDEEYSKYFPNGLIPSYAYHQFTAPLFLKREFKMEDEDILDAIRFHTTGKKDMSPLGMVLYAADKIEPTRGYDSSKMINLMLKDYKEGFREVLRANRDFLYGMNKDKIILDDFSTACFKAYLKG